MDLQKILKTFVDADNDDIVLISDYDKTLTPANFCSWDFPSLYEKEWPSFALELRNKYMNDQISEEEYWRKSLLGLEKYNFYNKFYEVDPTKYLEKLRKDMDETLQLFNQFSKTIIFSAGVGEVIEIHLKSTKTDLKNYTIISNFKDTPVINRSSKTGEILRERLKLDGYTHVILIGDDPKDADVLNGYPWDKKEPELLKLAITNEENYEIKKNQFDNSFDHISLDDEGMGEIPEILRLIVS